MQPIFLRYIRPGNVGPGRALAAKREQKNAGLDEHAKQKQSAHSKRMHAIVVFVQTGEQGDRRYKMLVAKCFVKRQQMRWTASGAHLLLQVRVQALNGDLHSSFERWYPTLQQTRARKFAA